MLVKSIYGSQMDPRHSRVYYNIGNLCNIDGLSASTECTLLTACSSVDSCQCFSLVKRYDVESLIPASQGIVIWVFVHSEHQVTTMQTDGPFIQNMNNPIGHKLTTHNKQHIVGVLLLQPDNTNVFLLEQALAELASKL